MKRYGILSTLAFIALAAAAVWLGGLNQDEGWYLYAARLVEEGKVPYRDFAYTQGPLLPIVYSVFCGAWEQFGVLGGRVVTISIGLMGLLFAAALARLLAAEGRKGAAGVIAFMLLGCNLYHIYYLAIPKTYALASFFLLMGFYLMAFGLIKCRAKFLRRMMLFGSGICLSFAAGARISTGACLAVAGFALLAQFKKHGWAFAALGLGGALGLALIYGPFVALPGFHDAILYHTSRGGFDPMITLGSFSRLVRWYLPVFVLAGMIFFKSRKNCGIVEMWSLHDQAHAKKTDCQGPCCTEPQNGNFSVPQSSSQSDILRIMVLSFLAVFVVQMLAPFPYEDYQVPVMALLAVFVAAKISSVAMFSVSRVALLTLGMTWACSFGSPLLEKWMTNPQDRFWPQKKEKCELSQLQDMAKVIETIDPGGKTLLTQDLYLAIETNRKVPEGLEMGPFSILTEEQWVKLLRSAPCPVAATSGYTFAINPPVCDERPMEQQMDFWGILKDNYDIVMKEDAFGQNATPLLILLRKDRGLYAGR